MVMINKIFASVWKESSLKPLAFVGGEPFGGSHILKYKSLPIFGRVGISEHRRIRMSDARRSVLGLQF